MIGTENFKKTCWVEPYFMASQRMTTLCDKNTVHKNAVTIGTEKYIIDDSTLHVNQGITTDTCHEPTIVHQDIMK